MALKNEKEELLWRIIIAIVGGFILSVWKVLIIFLSLFNWVYILFKDKKNKNISEFCEYWNSTVYIFTRYVTVVSDQRPFPFNDLRKIKSKI